ncbi:MAG: biopolymer transporter ExbD [Gammaproteobacteria bacterium]|nr:biopolymer transporter ExbD [Gammaproteobacteria bacterium]MYC25802.1 biopolymer transporter ExbD [Gammaproteobacteria bacterium]
MRNRARGALEEEQKINLTPMLDVVFIMLIFFIVTATFVKEIGIDVTPPEEDQPQTVDPEKKSIVIVVSARDQIQIGGRTVDVTAVRANIERLAAENPEAPVIINPHADSSADVFVRIWDAANLAGVETVQMAAD